MLFNTIEKRLKEAVKNEVNSGCKLFTMGTHGEFDNLALSVCRAIRNTNSNIEIEVVITSLKNLQKQIDQIYTPYSDVKTIMYDIENKHYETQKQ